MHIKFKEMKRSFFFGLIIFGSLFSIAQTNEQTSEFINKSNIALNKVQKEIMRSGDKSLEAGLKTALKYQVASVKFFKANNLKEAYECSYRSRMECVEILKEIKSVNSDYFVPAPGEEQLLKQDYKTISLKDGFLSKEEILKIDNLNIAEPQKMRELETNLN
jgi:hypothetical protein